MILSQTETDVMAAVVDGGAGEISRHGRAYLLVGTGRDRLIVTKTVRGLVAKGLLAETDDALVPTPAGLAAVKDFGRLRDDWRDVK